MPSCTTLMAAGVPKGGGEAGAWLAWGLTQEGLAPGGHRFGESRGAQLPPPEHSTPASRTEPNLEGSLLGSS